ncbi:Uncharacterized protein DBV15_02862 [Temnothorax longispinosus]|uniref:Uncharacterized protein n=1 Tax=Temnothorax longispinosus TaxID=300112 RepID=A0A4S2L2G2_9HYME|nr:Uncharacterized protein DBV15_02862 [Temnothorax longispinosus]
MRPRMPFCRPVMEIVDTLTGPYPANRDTPLFLPRKENLELVVGVPLRGRVGERGEIPRDNAFIMTRNPITLDAGAATLLGGHRNIAMDTREETTRRRRRRRNTCRQHVKEDIDGEIMRFVMCRADNPVKWARHSFPDKDGHSRRYPIAFTRGDATNGTE